MDWKQALEGLPLPERIALLEHLRESLQREVGASLGVESTREIESKNGAQARAFMISMLPAIWKHMLQFRQGTEFTVLDVGPGAGFGAELLAQLHSSRFLGYQVKVTTIDIRDTYADLIRLRSSYLHEQIYGDVFDLDRQFDLVTCSHVIEHVDDPVEFVRRLQQLAKQKVFVLAPWKERADRMTRGHIQRFSEPFTDHFPDAEHELLQSIAWGAFLQPRYQMLFMQLPGRVTSTTPIASSTG